MRAVNLQAEKPTGPGLAESQAASDCLAGLKESGIGLGVGLLAGPRSRPGTLE